MLRSVLGVALVLAAWPAAPVAGGPACPVLLDSRRVHVDRDGRAETLSIRAAVERGKCRFFLVERGGRLERVEVRERLALQPELFTPRIVGAVAIDRVPARGTTLWLLARTRP